MRRPSARRDDHGGRRRWRALALVATLLGAVTLSLGPAQGLTTAHAATCQDPVTGQLMPCHDTAPAALLNFTAPLYAASAAQHQALRALERVAVDDVVRAHGLPSSDAAAVQTWARDDTEAALWGLLVQAIQTPAASRSADQRNAVEWLTAVVQRQGVQAADKAGLEYVTWAGFDHAAYQSLLTTHPSQSALQAFLTGTPRNFNTRDKSQATGGFCVYRPPSPYQDEFSDRTLQTCFTPCTSVAGCIPNPPTYDQFVKWGEADVNSDLFSTPEFAAVSRDIAEGAALGSAFVGAGLVGAGISVLLPSVLAGSALQAALFPFAATQIAAVVPVVEGGVTTGGELVLTGAAEAAAIGGAVTAAGIGALASVVIAGVAIAVIQGINLTDAGALPGQLATLIANAPTTTPDLSTILSNTAQAQGLYALFVGATLPAPLVKSCDNAFVIGGPQGVPTPCLNAPAIPDPAASTDPAFVIAAKGATTATTSPTLSWRDTASQVTTTASLHGTWFIAHMSGPDGSAATVQTLRLRYTDWSGVERNAWLLHDPQKGYMFLGTTDAAGASTPLDPATCRADGTCSYSETINYVGADGKDDMASVIAPPVPLVAPTYSTPALAGNPITFDANGISPSGQDTTYQWRFERPGVITACFSGQTCDPYAYGAPVAGAQAQHNWDRAGTFHVELAATDAAGRTTVDTFAVDVAVTPTLHWTPAPSIRYGTPLDSVLLNATATVPYVSPYLCVGSPCPTEAPADGVYTYSVDDDAASPSQVLPVGRHRLTVQFTPSDPAHTVTPALLRRDLFVDTAPLTITATDQRMTYGRAVPGFAPDVSGLVNGETAASVLPGLSCGARDYHGSPITSSTLPNQYHIDCTFDTTHKPTNYHVRFVRGTLTVDPAPLTIRANDHEIRYGEPLPPLDARYSGFVNGDTESHAVDFHPPLCRTVDVAGQLLGSRPPAGQYTISCERAASHAYSVTYLPGRLEVRPAPLTVTARDQHMTYGGAVPAFDADASGLVNGDTLASLGLSCGARDGLQPLSPSSLPRQYHIECTFDHRPANYDARLVPGTLTIDPAPLTITANDQSMIAGREVPTFDARYSGFVNGDTESQAVDFHRPICRATDAAGLPVNSSTPAGIYPITCTGASSRRYSITYVPGTLTILPAL